MILQLLFRRLTDVLLSYVEYEDYAKPFCIVFRFIKPNTGALTSLGNDTKLLNDITVSWKNAVLSLSPAYSQWAPHVYFNDVSH